jgi:hypothetical protein
VGARSNEAYVLKAYVLKTYEQAVFAVPEACRQVCEHVKGTY